MIRSLIALNITFFLMFLFTGLITKKWKEAAKSSVFFLGTDFIFIFVYFIARFLE